MGNENTWMVEESGALYHRLRIYDRAGRIGDEVWRLVSTWDFFAKDTIGKQLVRAADSIAANLAEGSGRGTNPEILRFARIARGSLCETQHWISRAKKRKLVENQIANELENSLESLLKQVNAFISKMSQKP